MKKGLILLVLCASLLGYAQDVPTSFPRKFLLEHFTGSACGQCPEGMEAIKQYLATQTIPYIWVSHHYGYGQDEYSISESERIGKTIGVSGAPNVSINRTKQVGNFAFTPVYLIHPSVTIVDDTVAEASVAIQHTYDAASREASITVSGQVANTEVKEYLLTILVKENQLVGKQADNTYSAGAAPWLEYLHARTVRAMITPALGDTVTVVDQAYTHTINYTISDEWKAENCCIVAYLTAVRNTKPIINAEQVPLVAGTTGGEEYLPYGITQSAKPKKELSIDSIQTSKVSDNLLEVLLFDNSSVRVNSVVEKPVIRLYVNTEAETLEAGIYPIQADGAMGSVVAGYRIDEQMAFGGSVLTYVNLVQLKQGILTPDHIWRIISGEMVVDEAGKITLTCTTYNKTDVIAKSPTTNIEPIEVPFKAPKKILRDNQVIILHDGVEYNILGTAI